MSEAAISERAMGEYATGEARQHTRTGPAPLARYLPGSTPARRLLEGVPFRGAANLARAVDAEQAFHTLFESALAPPVEELEPWRIPAPAGGRAANARTMVFEGRLPVSLAGAPGPSRTALAVRSSGRDELGVDELYGALLAQSPAPLFISVACFGERTGERTGRNQLAGRGPVRVFPAVFIVPVDEAGTPMPIEGKAAAVVHRPGEGPQCRVFDAASEAPHLALDPGECAHLERAALTAAMYCLLCTAAAKEALVSIKQRQHAAVMDTTMLTDGLQRTGKAARRGLASAIETIAGGISG